MRPNSERHGEEEQRQREFRSGSHYPPLMPFPNLDGQFFLSSMSYPNIFSISSSFLLDLIQIGFLLFVIERFLLSAQCLTS